MYNLLIAIAAALVALFGFSGLLGGVFYGIFPAVIVFPAVYFVLMRRTLKQVEAVMLRAQAEMAKIQQAAMKPRARMNESQARDRVKEQMRGVIEIMKKAHAFNKWQFLVESQVNTQIGTLLYAIREFDDAEPYLRNAFLANSMSQSMLAVIYFRKRQYDRMEEAFERSVARDTKTPILWGVYAWCFWKNKDTDKALAVLNRASTHFPNNEGIQNNLLALQNKKNMDMTLFGEVWYQYQLARPPQMQAMQDMQKQMGRISRRGSYR